MKMADYFVQRWEMLSTCLLAAKSTKAEVQTALAKFIEEEIQRDAREDLIEQSETIDAWIDRLITALESRGIDATNWDGEDDTVNIIADGIASAVRDAREGMVPVEELKTFLKESEAAFKYNCQCPVCNLGRYLRAKHPELFAGGEGLCR